MTALKVIEIVGFTVGGCCTLVLLFLYWVYKTSTEIVDHNKGE